MLDILEKEISRDNLKKNVNLLLLFKTQKKTQFCRQILTHIESLEKLLKQ